MKYYEPNNKKAVFLISDNKGTQEKYYDNGYWYKINMFGNEGLAEELSSLILFHAILPSSAHVDFVEYEQCKIGLQKGCNSANFLYEGESYISLQNLCQNLSHEELSEKVFSITNEEDRYLFLINYVKNITGLDLSNYLRTCITLDFIIRNPDRHFGNLGVIMRSDGTFKEAPIFDNGQGLGQNYRITDPLMSHEDRLDVLIAATLTGSFTKALSMCGGPIFKLDYNALKQDLKNYPDSIAKNFLEEQLDWYEPIFNINYQKENDENNNIDYDNL